MSDHHPIRRPELAELEALVTALSAGSIGEAARRLGVSQPALSKRLRNLEAVCGARLLERSPSGVVATPAGARLAAAALRVVDEIALLDDVLTELRGQNAPVRLACSPVISETLLPELLSAARDDLAGLPIELTAANSSTVRRLVATGAADLGIAAADPTDPDAPQAAAGALAADVIAEDEVIVALPPSHPWVGKPSVSPQEVASESLLLRDPRAHARVMFDAAMHAAGLPIDAAAELGSTSAVVSAALDTGRPAVLSRLALGRDERLTPIPIEGLALLRRFILLPGPDPEPRVGVRRARAALLAAAQQLGAARDLPPDPEARRQGTRSA